MKSLGTLIRSVDDIKDMLRGEEYPVLGFDVILDEPEKFNPYCWESAEVAGFGYKQGMPDSQSFFYLSDEYEAYLTVLIESGLPHPANTDGRPWIDAPVTAKLKR